VEVLRAVLMAVGLLVVLVLALAVVGLAVAILAVMVHQAVEGGVRRTRPIRPIPRTLLILPAPANRVRDIIRMAVRDDRETPVRVTNPVLIPVMAVARRDMAKGASLD
jgi:hypothetical protein